jgi:rod shape-determining protein MreD
MSDATRAVLWRLVVLALATAIVQSAAVSQVPILGTSADLGPLVVMAVGLLLGGMTGAVFGFCLGLFVDVAQMQTVGITSLMYVIVGYWSGRARELRDPGQPLVAVAVGAAAALTFTCGYSIIEFLLGNDAPVSWLLLRQIVATTIVGGLLALPVYAVVRWVLAPAVPERSRRARARRRAPATAATSPFSSARTR